MPNGLQPYGERELVFRTILKSIWQGRYDRDSKLQVETKSHRGVHGSHMLSTVTSVKTSRRRSLEDGLPMLL